MLDPAEAAQSIEQLEGQIKALLQQEIKTQQSIQQLSGQYSDSVNQGLLFDDPWMMGAVCLVLGLCAWMFGSFLGRLTTRRRVLDASALEQKRFADSLMYLEDEAYIPMPPVHGTGSGHPVPATPNHASAHGPAVFPHMDFSPSGPLLEVEPESVLGLFLDDIHPLDSETAPPASQLQAEVETSVLELPMEAHAFDSKATADEVERVRKSLAKKRAARACQGSYDISVHAPLQPMDRSSDAPPDPVMEQTSHAVMQEDKSGEPSGGVDLLLDLPDELTLELQLPESEMPFTEEPFRAEDSVEPLQAVVIDPHAEPLPEPEPQPAAAVQLELALVLETLGLRDGARDIAHEVLESGDDKLRLKAEALVARLDALASAQRAKALAEDALLLVA